MAKRERSQLDIDISNAISMSMSYGRYMALVKHPVKVGKPEEPKKRVCPYCGKDMTYEHGGKKYCSAYCKQGYYDMKAAKQPAEKHCPICGKTFTGKSHQKYCCENCTRLGHIQKVREYQARKAMGGV